jgi:hypothetical protein
MSQSQRTTATPATWRDVRKSLDKMDRGALIALIRDLYDVGAMNRRVLHARFVPNTATFDLRSAWRDTAGWDRRDPRAS